MSDGWVDTELLRNGQLVLRVGPFKIRIQSDIDTVKSGIDVLYRDYPKLSNDSFCDFYARVFRPSGLRRYLHKQVLFGMDQTIPFLPLPYSQAYPFFEWGLNWCISNFAHQFLIIHAAVVEKQGRALILPGVPGSGKSTLCAALINKGWRLLSDELALIDCESGQLVPVPRPVSLKNESISLINSCFPGNDFSPVVHDTLKGSVSLMKAPLTSVLRANETAAPCLVVFPKYQADSSLTLSSLSKGQAFMKLADASFNYSILGADGFDVLADLVECSSAYDFVYGGDFNAASDCFEDLLSAGKHG